MRVQAFTYLFFGKETLWTANAGQARYSERIGALAHAPLYNRNISSGADIADIASGRHCTRSLLSCPHARQPSFRIKLIYLTVCLIRYRQSKETRSKSRPIILAPVRNLQESPVGTAAEMQLLKCGSMALFRACKRLRRRVMDLLLKTLTCISLSN